MLVKTFLGGLEEAAGAAFCGDVFRLKVDSGTSSSELSDSSSIGGRTVRAGAVGCLGD